MFGLGVHPALETPTRHNELRPVHLRPRPNLGRQQFRGDELTAYKNCGDIRSIVPIVFDHIQSLDSTKGIHIQTPTFPSLWSSRF
jgi:hypothetical protein